MASILSSFCFYKETLEWQLYDPRDCCEIGQGKDILIKRSPEVGFTVPLDNEKRSCPIYWYGQLSTIDYSRVGLVFDVYTNTKGNTIDKTIGLKLSLIVLDESNNVLYDNKQFTKLQSHCATNGSVYSWRISVDVIPRNCLFIKMCCTYQAYNWNTGTVPARTIPRKEAQIQYQEMVIDRLDKDRIAGVSTDAVLKLGQTEVKVHKCVLSLQSDFFKARFSDRWDSKDGDPCVVDMNDSELSPELLEALISGAYTGKVEDFDTAVKILPLADKYQFHTLKGVCEQFISGQLTRENVLDVYMLANQCSALTLQEKCKVLIKM